MRRIKTLEGNWLVALDQYRFYYIAKDMKTVLREVDAEEWAWAVLCWNRPIRRGNWDLDTIIQEFHFQAILEFERKEEIVKDFFNAIPPKTLQEYCEREVNNPRFMVTEDLQAKSEELFAIVSETHEYPVYDEYVRYILNSYDIYEKIANLPKCEIVTLKGTSYSTDRYSGGTEEADLKDYNGKFPVIIKTHCSEYWRGNSSRSWTKYYFVPTKRQLTNKTGAVVIVTKGDGFGIVNDCNTDFSFEEIYNATHSEETL